MIDIRSLIFGKNAFVCIFCGRRLKKTDSIFIYKHIGVCKYCNETLPYTKPGNVFEAGPTLDFLISPFYYMGNLRNALIEYKFKGCYEYAYIFSHFLNTYLGVFEYMEEYDWLHNYNLIVPVPISNERNCERGYNQSDLVAKKISEEFSIEICSEALVRKEHTKRQSTMERFQRYTNVMNAFDVVTEKVKGRKVYLVDDIYTTGSTLDVCAKEIIKAGAERVAGITIATAYKQQHSDAYKELFY